MILTVALIAQLVSDPAVVPRLPDGRPIVATETLVAFAMHENPKLDTEAVNLNTNGTEDEGLMQINSVNFKRFGVTNPFDPRQSIHAAALLLQQDYGICLNSRPPGAPALDCMASRYNTGNQTAGISNGYVARLRAVHVPALSGAEEPSTVPVDDGAHDAVAFHRIPPEYLEQ